MSTKSKGNQDRFFLVLIGILSVVIPVVVAVLLFYPQVAKLSNADFSFLPSLNAILNSTTALLLIIALVFIKNGKQKLHSATMLGAVGVSVLFLVSYVIYHSQSPPTHFGGEGAIKYVYYTVLTSHIILAVVVLPFVLLAVYFGLTGKFTKHKKIVRWGFPIWLYVAISGVLVYLLIRPYY